jgi:septal ring factor EnvC (AmiA/AmiB activator)
MSLKKPAPQSEPVGKSSPGIKNLGKAISNLKKDVAYDLQHVTKNPKSKVDLEKEKQEKEHRLKEALHDRESADKNIKELIDEVVAQKRTIAAMEETIGSKDSKIDELSHELENETQEKNRENREKLAVEEQLAQEKKRSTEIEELLKQETQAKMEEIALKEKEIQYPSTIILNTTLQQERRTGN